MRYIPKRDKGGHFIPVITNRTKICAYCGKEFTPPASTFQGTNSVLHLVLLKVILLEGKEK
jgi:hypothetical protein